MQVQLLLVEHIQTTNGIMFASGRHAFGHTAAWGQIQVTIFLNRRSVYQVKR